MTNLGPNPADNGNSSSYNHDMTLEEYLEKSRDPLWYGEQDENGVDLSLIQESLRRTPEQRLLRGDGGRRSALQLREYGILHRSSQLRQGPQQK